MSGKRASQKMLASGREEAACAPDLPTTRVLALETPWNLSLELTVNSHGWVNLPPWSWNASTGTLSRPERIDGSLGLLSVRQETDKRILVEWTGERWEDAHLRSIASRWLMADWDPDPFLESEEARGSSVASLVSNGGGRFLRGTTFFEDFVKTVCTINTTWNCTKRMVGNLVDRVGLGLFPAPFQLLECGATLLKNDCSLGYRAERLVECTRRLLDEALIDEVGRCEVSPSRDDLLALPGIGPYAANHCRVLLEDYSRVPIDSEVTAYLDRLTGQKPQWTTQSPSGPWSYLLYKGQRILDKSNWLGD